MNSHDDKQDEFRDARVTRAYRAVSDERTPPGLDRKILAAARHTVDNDAGKRNAWFRPLAFAATLVLGVALLFEMRSEFEPGMPEPLHGLSPISGDPGDEATMTPNGGVERPRTDGLEPGRGVRKPALPGRERTPAAIAAPQGKARQHTGSALSNEQDRHCRAEQVVDAKAWWRCIEALSAAGDADAADAELRRLRERFPDFRPDP